MRTTWKPLSNETKPLTLLLALTFLFLFGGSVYGQEEVKKEYYDNGKSRSEERYQDGKKEGLWLDGIKTDRKNLKNITKMET